MKEREIEKEHQTFVIKKTKSEEVGRLFATISTKTIQKADVPHSFILGSVASHPTRERERR